MYLSVDVRKYSILEHAGAETSRQSKYRSAPAAGLARCRPSPRRVTPPTPGPGDLRGRGRSRREAEAWPRSPPAPRPPRGVPPASRGPGPQTQARKASVHLPAPRSGCRRCRRRAAHPRCQVSHPAHGPSRAQPGHDPKPVGGGPATPATQVGLAHAPPGFEHLCPRKLISSKARPKLRLSLNANTCVTWPELRGGPHLQSHASKGFD